MRTAEYKNAATSAAVVAFALIAAACGSGGDVSTLAQGQTPGEEQGSEIGEWADVVAWYETAPGGEPVQCVQTRSSFDGDASEILSGDESNELGVVSSRESITEEFVRITGNKYKDLWFLPVSQGDLDGVLDSPSPRSNPFVYGPINVEPQQLMRGIGTRGERPSVINGSSYLGPAVAAAEALEPGGDYLIAFSTYPEIAEDEQGERSETGRRGANFELLYVRHDEGEWRPLDACTQSRLYAIAELAGTPTASVTELSTMVLTLDGYPDTAEARSTQSIRAKLRRLAAQFDTNGVPVEEAVPVASEPERLAEEDDQGVRIEEIELYLTVPSDWARSGYDICSAWRSELAACYDLGLFEHIESDCSSVTENADALSCEDPTLAEAVYVGSRWAVGEDLRFYLFEATEASEPFLDADPAQHNGVFLGSVSAAEIGGNEDPITIVIPDGLGSPSTLLEGSRGLPDELLPAIGCRTSATTRAQILTDCA